ncbi:MAG TPA: hypothetical protein VM940_03260, partial [Chthoniobacterales bacterium]|nr:hypothetical protein [Chthoniobacterales bacterium]
DMIGCEKLTPFRDHTSEQISSLPSRYSYFQFGAKWTYDKVFAAWSIALLALLFVSWRNPRETGFPALAITLTLTGLLMFAASCFLVDDQPRFRLPLWQMLVLSLFIVMGSTARVLAERKSLLGPGSGRL